MQHNHGANTLEPVSLEPMLHNERSPLSEMPTHNKEEPRLPQLEKACTQQQRPSASRDKWINQSINYF